MDIAFPYRFDSSHRTATAGTDAPVRDLIEQVLFTAPGERGNRPTFGCGLLRMVFEPASTETAAAIQFLVHGALQQWLGDVIMVEDVAIASEDGRLGVTVVYTVRRSQEQQTAQFSRSVPA